MILLARYLNVGPDGEMSPGANCARIKLIREGVPALWLMQFQLECSSFIDVQCSVARSYCLYLSYVVYIYILYFIQIVSICVCLVFFKHQTIHYHLNIFKALYEHLRTMTVSTCENKIVVKEAPCVDTFASQERPEFLARSVLTIPLGASMASNLYRKKWTPQNTSDLHSTAQSLFSSFLKN